MTRRPTEAQARAAIDSFLLEKLGEIPSYSMGEDGDESSAENKCGWAFWFGDSDTSYVHEDLTIEWYGFPSTVTCEQTNNI